MERKTLEEELLLMQRWKVIKRDQVCVEPTRPFSVNDPNLTDRFSGSDCSVVYKERYKTHFALFSRQDNTNGTRRTLLTLEKKKLELEGDSRALTSLPYSQSKLWWKKLPIPFILHFIKKGFEIHIWRKRSFHASLLSECSSAIQMHMLPFVTLQTHQLCKTVSFAQINLLSLKYGTSMVH